MELLTSVLNYRNEISGESTLINKMYGYSQKMMRF